MQTINRMLVDLNKKYKTNSSNEKIETIFFLSGQMPNINDDDVYRNIFFGLDDLFQEIKTHNEDYSRRRLTTFMESDMNKQVIEIAWNGKPLNQRTINKSNKKYLNGAMFPKIEIYASGTTTAGYYLIGKCSGAVRIENFKDGIYTLRNLIKLPTYPA